MFCVLISYALESPFTPTSITELDCLCFFDMMGERWGQHNNVHVMIDKENTAKQENTQNAVDADKVLEYVVRMFPQF